MELGSLFRLILFNLLDNFLVKAYLSNSPHIITFWGQDPALQDANKVERALNKTCGPKSSYSTVVLGFVSKSIRNKTTASLPPMHCVKSAKSRSKLSLYCPEISKKVEQCKLNKKKVLIGVGGPNETLYFDDARSAQYFAKKIWNWFLGGTEISEMRPFGGIALDGVNIFLKDDKSKYVDVFLKTLNTLRNRVDDDDNTKYVYTMSVPCNAPEAYFGDGKNRLSLDKVVPIIKQIYVRYSGKQCCKSGPKHFRGELQEWKKFSITKDRPGLFVLFPRSPHKTMTNCFSSNRQLNILHNIIILKRKLGDYTSKRKFEYLKYLSCYAQQLASENPPYLANISQHSHKGKKKSHNAKSAKSSSSVEDAEETFTKLDVKKPDFSSAYASRASQTILPSVTLPLKYKNVPWKMKTVLGFQRPDSEYPLIDPQMTLDFVLNFEKSHGKKDNKRNNSAPFSLHDMRLYNTQLDDSQHRETQLYNSQLDVPQHREMPRYDTQLYKPQHDETQRYDDTQHRATQLYNTQRHDAQLYDTQHDDTQLYDTQQHIMQFPDTQQQNTQLDPTKQSLVNTSNIYQPFLDESRTNTPLDYQFNDPSNYEVPLFSPALWNMEAFKIGTGDEVGKMGNMGYQTYTNAMDGISNILQKYSNQVDFPAISTSGINVDYGETPKGIAKNKANIDSINDTPTDVSADTAYRDKAFNFARVTPQPDDLSKNNLNLENIISPDSNTNPHLASMHEDVSHGPMDDIPNALEKLEHYITSEMDNSKNQTATALRNLSAATDSHDDDDYVDTEGDIAIKRSDAIEKIQEKRTLRASVPDIDSCFNPNSKSVFKYGQSLLAIKLIKKLLKRNLELFNRDIRNEDKMDKHRSRKVKKHTRKRYGKNNDETKLKSKNHHKQKINIIIKKHHKHGRKYSYRGIDKGRRMPLFAANVTENFFAPNPGEEEPSFKSSPKLDDVSSQRMLIPGEKHYIDDRREDMIRMVDLLLVMAENHDRQLDAEMLA